MDLLERQLEELGVIRSIFGEDSLSVDFEAVARLKSACRAGGAETVRPSLIFSVRCQRWEAEVELPPDYPERAAPRISVRHDRAVSAQLASFISELWRGSECLFEALQRLDECVAAIPDALGPFTSTPPLALGPTFALERGRRLVWFHHIKNVSKRRDILKWARELQLRG